MASKNRRVGFLLILLPLIIILFVVNRRQRQTEPAADLILINGKIVTVDTNAPQASWLAVRGDRIAALGWAVKDTPKGQVATKA